MSSTVAIIFTVLYSVLSPTELYNEGNQLFEAGDYAAAVKSYERAAETTSNAQLFYNLGNSYFKTGKIGKAILNYRRASFLAPRDADIAFNLAFARHYRVDKTKTTTNPFEKGFTRIMHLCSMHDAQVVTSVFFVITCVALSLFIIYRRKAFSYVIYLFAVVCIFFFICWQSWHAELTSHVGVVIVPEVRALSGPADDYKDILVLHDGTEITVRDRRNDYALIQLPGGLGGWVEQNAIAEIYSIP
jgi:hypothetical protein